MKKFSLTFKVSPLPVVPFGVLIKHKNFGRFIMIFTGGSIVTKCLIRV